MPSPCSRLFASSSFSPNPPPLVDEEGDVVVEESASAREEEEWEESDDNATLFSMRDADKDEDADSDGMAAAKNPRYELQPHVKPMDQVSRFILTCICIYLLFAVSHPRDCANWSPHEGDEGGAPDEFLGAGTDW